jgi:hypothetical protein
LQEMAIGRILSSEAALGAKASLVSGEKFC